MGKSDRRFMRLRPRRGRLYQPVAVTAAPRAGLPGPPRRPQMEPLEPRWLLSACLPADEPGAGSPVGPPSATEVALPGSNAPVGAEAGDRVLVTRGTAQEGSATFEMGETGKINDLTHEPRTVMLEHSYANPVVIARPVSYEGAEPVIVRITDVRSDRFTMHLLEPPDLNGAHTAEAATYLVVESGTWQLDNGMHLAADMIRADATAGLNIADTWVTVTFENLFDAAPLVFSQVQTAHDPSYVSTRQRGITPAGFTVAMEKEEAALARHAAAEAIGYVALETGSGAWSGHAFEAGYTSDAVTDAWYTQVFATPFATAPVVLAGVSSYDEVDSAHARQRSASAGSVQVMVEEDTTFDAEVGHTTETLGYLAIEGAGVLRGVPTGPAVGEIRGAKWHDLDGDGVRDVDEPGLEGWTVYLDVDGDGRPDDDEPVAVTGTGGDYVFETVPPGTYAVAEVAQAGWTQTHPSQGIRYTTIAVTDRTAAPSAGAGATFASFANFDPVGAAINDPGQVAFHGILREGTGDVTGSTNQGMWMTSPEGTLLEVLRAGVTVPSGIAAGNRFAGGRTPVMNEDGRLAFQTFLRQGTGDTTSQNDESVWAFSADDGLALIARQGSSGTSAPYAPGTAPGTKFFRFEPAEYPPVLNDAAAIAIRASLRQGTGDATSSTDSGIWGPTVTAAFGLIARKGTTQVGGTATGTRFEGFGEPVLNDLGQVVFRADLRIGTGDVTGGNAEGIWRTTTDPTPVLVARTGVTHAWGTAAGTRFNSFGEPTVNNAEHVAFAAALRTGTGDATPVNASGIWGPTPSSALDLIVRAGSGPAPGTNGTFRAFNSPVLNAVDQVAFVGSLRQDSADVNGTNDSGVWGPRGDGTLALIAREGMDAPGTAEGVKFAEFTSRSDPVLNAAGQIAFMAGLRSDSPRAPIDSANDEGIWLYNPWQDALVLIAREGDRFDIGDGSGRTVASVAMLSRAGGQDGRATSLNENGQLAFVLGFTDGSQGVFVADVHARQNTVLGRHIVSLDVSEVVSGIDFGNLRTSLVVGEIGQVTDLTHEERTVLLQRSYVDPVVFAQPPSYNGAGPVIVRISDVRPDRFTLRLQEPSDKDDVHGGEMVSYAVFEAGQWQLSDGTLLEVGTVQSDATVGNQVSDPQWANISLNAPFGDTPVVLSQVQTGNDPAFVKTRQRDTTPGSVEIAMEGEQAAATAHGAETVAFLAIEPGAGELSGIPFEALTTPARFDDAGDDLWFGAAFGQAPRFLASLATYHGADPVAVRVARLTGGHVHALLQEDTTFDEETGHTAEAISYLALGRDGLLTGQPIAGDVIGEVGRIEDLTHERRVVPLQRVYRNPVVIAQSPSRNGGSPVVVRVTDVHADSFTLFLQEPSNLNGEHTTEAVTYLVVEAGRWRLPNGAMMAARALDTSASVGDRLPDPQWDAVVFATPFGRTPVVLSQVQSEHDPSLVKLRHRGLTPAGFDLALEGEEAAAGAHATETIGFVALEAGIGYWGGLPMEGLVTDPLFDDLGATIAFRQRFDGAPGFLSSMSTYEDPDAVALRYEQLTATAVAVRAEEETTHDEEIAHAPERISYLALGGTGPLVASRAEEQPPAVRQVLVSGSEWAAAFLAELEARQLGHGGYRVPVGSDEQLRPLAWSGIDRITIIFDEDVLADRAHLALVGLNTPVPAFVDFGYDPQSFAATWHLEAPLRNDTFLLHLSDAVTDRAGHHLDGDWSQGVSTLSGDGTPGGDFAFRVNVLPGDLNQDGVNSVLDVAAMRGALDGVTEDGPADVMADFNGNSAIDGSDVDFLRSGIGNRLPAGEPVVPSGVAGLSQAFEEIRPPTRRHRLIAALRSDMRRADERVAHGLPVRGSDARTSALDRWTTPPGGRIGRWLERAAHTATSAQP